jgi:ATP-dependent RNA helicase RhlE
LAKKAFLRVAGLHGRLTQGQRDKALAALGSGQAQVLVATDLAARGLHVKGLAHVVNFDLPLSGRVADAYPHRVGRTGRAGRQGIAMTLIATATDSPAAVLEVSKLLRSSRVALPQELRDLVSEIEARRKTVQEAAGEDDDGDDDDGDDDDGDDDDGDGGGGDDDDGGDGGGHGDGGGGHGDGGNDESAEGSAGGGRQWSKREFREEVWEFYEEHAPSKLATIDALVEKYFGVVDPTDFMAALREKYVAPLRSKQ